MYLRQPANLRVGRSLIYPRLSNGTDNVQLTERAQ